VRNGDERVTRDLLAGEALYILKNLKDNKAGSRSNKLADVKASLEPTVTLEFDNYFFFLRKYNYIAMDREACLQLTGEGEKVLDGTLKERFSESIGEYFSSRLGDEAPLEPVRRQPPPPPPTEAAPIKLTADAVIAEVAGQGPGPFDAPASSPFEPPQAPPPPPARKAKRTSVEQEPPVPQPARPPDARPEREDAKPRPGASAELDSRYSKSDTLGAGPLATVYRGKHSGIGIDVAIKELKDIFGYFSFLQRTEVIKRLKREISSQAAVRHPCVVQVLDQNLDTARPYYVVELCSGGSLRDEMDEVEGKGLKVDQAIRYFLQMCYGLRAAHAQGLIHQNLKPENVIIDHLGNAKLSDFGLTRVIEVDSVKGMPQVFVGTGGMGYLPPELLSRSKSVTASADVYSLGILFYEMLTGAIPGRRSPLPSQARKDVPEKLDALFDKMTQDRKDDRIPDIDGVLTEFYAAFGPSEWLKKGDLVLWSESTAAASRPSAPAEQ
jgi:hypothetical protein